MGVNCQLWPVDLDAIRAVWASRDEALLARLDAPTHRYTARLLEGRRDALIEVLIGGACDVWEPSDHHYAVEAICYELRSPLDVEADVSSRSLQRLEDVLDVSLERFVPLQESWFVPLPDSEDFPFVGWVERQHAAALAEQLRALCVRANAFVAAHPESEAAQVGDERVLTHLAQVYAEAAARALDVVVFQH